MILLACSGLLTWSSLILVIAAAIVGIFQGNYIPAFGLLLAGIGCRRIALGIIEHIHARVCDECQ